MHLLRPPTPSLAFLPRSEFLVGFVLLLLLEVGCLPTSSSGPVITTSSPASALSTPTTFPIIYVASAVVDCGVPLVPDPCSTYLFDSIFPISAAASSQKSVDAGTREVQHVISKTITSAVTVYGTDPMANCSTSNQTLVYTSTSFYVVVSSIESAQVTTDLLSISEPGHLAFSTSLSIGSITRLTEERNYKPSLIHTVGPPLPGVIFKRFVPSTKLILPISPTLALRSYDYDRCYNVPPSHDMVTNSLTDVCHFVANAENYFVSLMPISSAAYMPSWVGYFWQALQAFTELWSIV